MNRPKNTQPSPKYKYFMYKKWIIRRLGKKMWAYNISDEHPHGNGALGWVPFIHGNLEYFKQPMTEEELFVYML